ncbi:hypothetical protein ACLI07_21180 [Providencia huaxiensis]|nr:hypothetical protein [Providencia sp. PROV076]
MAIWPYSEGVRYLVNIGSNIKGIAAFNILETRYIDVFFAKLILLVGFYI